ncbi:DUF4349 domain-containing protein [Gemmata massiliana]|uniref:DUF4349 domain-containing protein n=1 Tax=Gemmata massiliana TaxID=1210884 RepID=UPI0013A6980A
MRLTSQDVTKAYTDTESRLRGARTMEQRLLQIIKEGKGEIKQLLEAERELGCGAPRSRSSRASSGTTRTGPRSAP